MSSGKVHNRVSLIAAGLVGLSSLRYSTDVVLPIVSGCIVGILMTPDWDLDAGSNSNAHARKLKIGLPFNLLIRPYSLAYTHRSKQSHLPIISTLGRLVYLLIPFVVLFTANQPTGKIKLLWHCLFAQLMTLPLWLLAFWLYLNPQYDLTLIYCLAGLCLSDTLHWMFDISSKIL